MKKAPAIIILLLIFVIMEAVAWMILTLSKEESSSISEVVNQEVSVEPKSQEELKQTESKGGFSSNFSSFIPEGGMDGESGGFPLPTTQVVNGRTERTIHMGVRRYIWEPAVITAKQGELVRLIIHNADVLHGIVIPDLGVMEGNVPPEGAVIEFTASKAGTFEFFCSVWCGEGHMEMRGKIVIE